MKITLPSIQNQQKAIFEAATNAAIKQLTANLAAPVVPGQTEIDESQYSRAHLLRENEGWEAPDPDIIAAYFRHFQAHFPKYNTDAKLAALLGLSSDRRVREYKSGARVIPFGIWRKFLIMTGRAPQDVLPVLAFMA